MRSASRAARSYSLAAALSDLIASGVWSGSSGIGVLLRASLISPTATRSRRPSVRRTAVHTAAAALDGRSEETPETNWLNLASAPGAGSTLRSARGSYAEQSRTSAPGGALRRPDRQTRDSRPETRPRQDLDRLDSDWSTEFRSPYPGRAEGKRDRCRRSGRWAG